MASVLATVAQVELPVATKDELVAQLEARGIAPPIANWFTTVGHALSLYLLLFFSPSHGPSFATAHSHARSNTHTPFAPDSYFLTHPTSRIWCHPRK